MTPFIIWPFGVKTSWNIILSSHILSEIELSVGWFSITIRLGSLFYRSSGCERTRTFLSNLIPFPLLCYELDRAFRQNWEEFFKYCQTFKNMTKFQRSRVFLEKKENKGRVYLKLEIYSKLHFSLNRPIQSVSRDVSLSVCLWVTP